MAKDVIKGSIFLGTLLVAASLLHVLPFTEELEAKYGLSQLMRWQGAKPPPDKTAVIAITENTAEYLGLPKELNKWSRQIYADLVGKLTELNVDTIVFDIYFRNAREEQGDLNFARAMHEHGKIVLFAYSQRTMHPISDQVIAEMDRVLEPLPAFQQAASRTAPFVLPKIPGQVSSFVLRHQVFPPRNTLPAVALELSQPAVWKQYADKQPGKYWYNFYGPPKTITTLALEDILKSSGTAHNLTGSTVFVGYSSIFQPEQDDGFQTAFTSKQGHDISGVELAATAYANLRDNTHAYKGAGWLWPAIVACYSLIGLLLANYTERFTPAVLSLLGAVYVTGAYLSLSFWNVWIPWLMSCFIITPALVFYGYQSRVSRLRQQRLSLEHAFGRYVPASEIDRLLQDPQVRVTEQCLFGVCMVTDAQGYTAVAEKLGAARTGELMQDYLAAIIDPIRDSGGLISDVAGDGVIAVWPQLSRETAFGVIHPVIAAIQSGVDKFNSEHPQSPLPTRIGVHGGELVLGHFGAADHYEFRAIGDIVNTASRIESANKKFATQVLVSGACLPEHFSNMKDAKLRYHGNYRLAGKSSSIQLYTPLDCYPPVNQIEPELVESCEQAISQLEEGNLTQAKELLTQIRKDYPEDKTVHVLWQWVNQSERTPANFRAEIVLH